MEDFPLGWVVLVWTLFECSDIGGGVFEVSYLPLRPQMATFSPAWIVRFRFFKARFWGEL